MDEAKEGTFDALLREERRFPPGEAFRAEAHWNDGDIYDKAGADLESFWAEMSESIDWFTPWEKVLEGEAPSFQWFVGGRRTSATTALTAI